MQRPWVQPAEVKEYSESAKVAARSNVRLAYDLSLIHISEPTRPY